MKLYDELIWRGLIKDVSDETLAKKLLNEEKIKFYCGFDPTGQSLTVGHLVQIVRILLLAKYGHTPIVLIGGATGLIGDPKQTAERKLLTVKESLENAEKIKIQLSRFIDEHQAIYVNNYDWIKHIDMIAFLRDYGKLFSINYMLAKDTVQRRLDIGISYTEFSYMLLQAIDFLNLYQHEGCQMQFGGSDQWGNITTGLEMIRKVAGDKAEAVGLSSPLLLKADGTKFGKSESGTLWLDADLTSPYELYQYFVNASDADVETYLKMLTLLDQKTILRLKEQAKTAPELREAQKTLASEVVQLVHGEEALKEAIKVTDALFSGDFNDLSEKAFGMLVKVLDTVNVTQEINVVDALIKTKLASSKREAREFVSSHAVSLNGQKLLDLSCMISKNLALFNRYVVIRRGKKKYALIVLN